MQNTLQKPTPPLPSNSNKCATNLPAHGKVLLRKLESSSHSSQRCFDLITSPTTASLGIQQAPQNQPLNSTNSNMNLNHQSSSNYLLSSSATRREQYLQGRGRERGNVNLNTTNLPNNGPAGLNFGAINQNSTNTNITTNKDNFGFHNQAAFEAVETGSGSLLDPPIGLSIHQSYEASSFHYRGQVGGELGEKYGGRQQLFQATDQTPSSNDYQESHFDMFNSHKRRSNQIMFQNDANSIDRNGNLQGVEAQKVAGALHPTMDHIQMGDAMQTPRQTNFNKKSSNRLLQLNKRNLTRPPIGELASAETNRISKSPMFQFQDYSVSQGGLNTGGQNSRKHAQNNLKLRQRPLANSNCSFRDKSLILDNICSHTLMNKKDIESSQLNQQMSSSPANNNSTTFETIQQRKSRAFETLQNNTQVNNSFTHASLDQSRTAIPHNISSQQGDIQQIHYQSSLAHESSFSSYKPTQFQNRQLLSLANNQQSFQLNQQTQSSGNIQNLPPLKQFSPKSYNKASLSTSRLPKVVSMSFQQQDLSSSNNTGQNYKSQQKSSKNHQQMQLLQTQRAEQKNNKNDVSVSTVSSSGTTNLVSWQSQGLVDSQQKDDCGVGIQGQNNFNSAREIGGHKRLQMVDDRESKNGLRKSGLAQNLPSNQRNVQQMVDPPSNIQNSKQNDKDEISNATKFVRGSLQLNSMSSSQIGHRRSKNGDSQNSMKQTIVEKGKQQFQTASKGVNSNKKPPKKTIDHNFQDSQNPQRTEEQKDDLNSNKKKGIAELEASSGIHQRDEKVNRSLNMRRKASNLLDIASRRTQKTKNQDISQPNQQIIDKSCQIGGENVLVLNNHRRNQSQYAQKQAIFAQSGTNFGLNLLSTSQNEPKRLPSSKNQTQSSFASESFKSSDKQITIQKQNQGNNNNCRATILPHKRSVKKACPPQLQGQTLQIKQTKEAGNSTKKLQNVQTRSSKNVVCELPLKTTNQTNNPTSTNQTCQIITMSNLFDLENPNHNCTLVDSGSFQQQPSNQQSPTALNNHLNAEPFSFQNTPREQIQIFSNLSPKNNHFIQQQRNSVSKIAPTSKLTNATTNLASNSNNQPQTSRKLSLKMKGVLKRITTSGADYVAKSSIQNSVQSGQSPTNKLLLQQTNTNLNSMQLQQSQIQQHQSTSLNSSFVNKNHQNSSSNTVISAAAPRRQSNKMSNASYSSSARDLMQIYGPVSVGNPISKTTTNATSQNVKPTANANGSVFQSPRAKQLRNSNSLAQRRESTTMQTTIQNNKAGGLTGGTSNVITFSDACTQNLRGLKVQLQNQPQVDEVVGVDGDQQIVIDKSLQKTSQKVQQGVIINRNFNGRGGKTSEREKQSRKMLQMLAPRELVISKPTSRDFDESCQSTGQMGGFGVGNASGNSAGLRQSAVSLTETDESPQRRTGSFSPLKRQTLKLVRNPSKKSLEQDQTVAVDQVRQGGTTDVQSIKLSKQKKKNDQKRSKQQQSQDLQHVMIDDSKQKAEIDKAKDGVIASDKYILKEKKDKMEQKRSDFKRISSESPNKSLDQPQNSKKLESDIQQTLGKEVQPGSTIKQSLVTLQSQKQSTEIVGIAVCPAAPQSLHVNKAHQFKQVFRQRLYNNANGGGDTNSNVTPNKNVSDDVKNNNSTSPLSQMKEGPFKNGNSPTKSNQNYQLVAAGGCTQSQQILPSLSKQNSLDPLQNLQQLKISQNTQKGQKQEGLAGKSELKSGCSQNEIINSSQVNSSSAQYDVLTNVKQKSIVKDRDVRKHVQKTNGNKTGGKHIGKTASKMINQTIDDSIGQNLMSPSTLNLNNNLLCLSQNSLSPPKRNDFAALREEETKKAQKPIVEKFKYQTIDLLSPKQGQNVNQNFPNAKLNNKHHQTSLDYSFDCNSDSSLPINFKIAQSSRKGGEFGVNSVDRNNHGKDTFNRRGKRNGAPAKHMGSFIRKMSGPASKLFPPGFFPERATSIDSNLSKNSATKLSIDSGEQFVEPIMNRQSQQVQQNNALRIRTETSQNENEGERQQVSLQKGLRVASLAVQNQSNSARPSQVNQLYNHQGYSQNSDQLNSKETKQQLINNAEIMCKNNPMGQSRDLAQKNAMKTLRSDEVAVRNTCGFQQKQRTSLPSHQDFQMRRSIQQQHTLGGQSNEKLTNKSNLQAKSGSKAVQESDVKKSQKRGGELIYSGAAQVNQQMLDENIDREMLSQDISGSHNGLIPSQTLYQQNKSNSNTPKLPDQFTLPVNFKTNPSENTPEETPNIVNNPSLLDLKNTGNARYQAISNGAISERNANFIQNYPSNSLQSFPKINKTDRPQVFSQSTARKKPQNPLSMISQSSMVSQGGSRLQNLKSNSHNLIQIAESQASPTPPSQSQLRNDDLVASGKHPAQSITGGISSSQKNQQVQSITKQSQRNAMETFSDRVQRELVRVQVKEVPTHQLQPSQAGIVSASSQSIQPTAKRSSLHNHNHDHKYEDKRGSVATVQQSQCNNRLLSSQLLQQHEPQSIQSAQKVSGCSQRIMTEKKRTILGGASSLSIRMATEQKVLLGSDGVPPVSETLLPDLPKTNME